MGGMLILWWIHGKLRWSLRLAGMIAVGAALLAGLLAPGHGSDPGVWNIILGAAGFVGVLSLLLKSWKWRRWTIASGIAEPTDVLSADGGRWQAPLKDLLILITALALLLGVMRFSSPGARELFVLVYVWAMGAGLAATVFISTWAAFSPRPVWMRLLVTAFTAVVFGAAPSVFASWGVDPLWWRQVLYGATAGVVFLSLSVFRLHGYRLAKVTLPPGAGYGDRDTLSVADAAHIPR
jgi:hypothetical protein